MWAWTCWGKRKSQGHWRQVGVTVMTSINKSWRQHDGCPSITINVATSTINVATYINKCLCQHGDEKSLIESTMVWLGRCHLAFAVANCVLNLRFAAALLQVCCGTVGRWRGPQYDGKCSFYFNCYFFRKTPTNRDLREKAVYFPPRIAGNSARSLTSPRWAPTSPHRALIYAWCFTSGSWCFNSGSQRFTCVSCCFTMFNNVLWCLASRGTIGDRASADRLRDRDNAAGIGDNSAEIGDDSAGIANITANVIPSQTRSWMETGVTLFLEDKFQRGNRVTPVSIQDRV